MMAKKAKTTDVQTEPVIAYKGFDKNLVCNPSGTPFQFELGKTYSVEGEVRACRNGFHACEHPTSVLQYYPAIDGTRYCQVELSGDLDVDGDKTAARTIKVVRELSLTELINEAVAFTVARAKLEEGATASGDHGAATASGYHGAATASGYQGAATASGYHGAATASGTQGAATASGYHGAATASGYQGAATASGDHGAATASGTQGAATASGTQGAATASGIDGRARGKDGCALFLVERVSNYSGDDHGKILNVWAGIVGQDSIKPDTFYRLVDGKPVEVE